MDPSLNRHPGDIKNPSPPPGAGDRLEEAKAADQDAGRHGDESVPWSPDRRCRGTTRGHRQGAPRRRGRDRAPVCAPRGGAACAV